MVMLELWFRAFIDQAGTQADVNESRSPASERSERATRAERGTGPLRASV